MASFRIEPPAQCRRIFSPVDIRDLCCGKGQDLIILVIPEKGVEIMEIPSCRAHDNHFFLHSTNLLAE